MAAPFTVIDELANFALAIEHASWPYVTEVVGNVIVFDD